MRLDAATKKWLDGLSNEEKQEHYIREALKIFPGECAVHLLMISVTEE